MRIGQLANEAGVNVQTVRLYERLGLLQKPIRRASGYRDYTEDAIASIRFIKQAKELGFTLSDIKSLLDMRRRGSHTVAEMRATARARLEVIDEKIKQLEQMRDAIRYGLANCKCPEQFPECVFVRLFDHTHWKSKGDKDA
jgi:DNA-binding transcriptional MerR regulator